jgi:hypothetical protein
MDEDTQQPDVKVQEEYHVDMSQPRVVDLDRLAGQAAKIHGGHGWAISLIHAVEDPEMALDDMTLGADSFVGLSQIYCLWCHTVYSLPVRDDACSAASTKGSIDG